MIYLDSNFTLYKAYTCGGFLYQKEESNATIIISRSNFKQTNEVFDPKNIYNLLNGTITIMQAFKVNLTCNTFQNHYTIAGIGVIFVKHSQFSDFNSTYQNNIAYKGTAIYLEQCQETNIISSKFLNFKGSSITDHVK
ncbi:UNKNOWN [Stylonychia lemnae]|uniref:Right handed beta helix domain-containing protein n=1 Tax=Stylonychia lemnae TaxID=5949 RepID=A0A078AJ89_STYLE|nr:UNKNOWN [Stylonychia lemnae]|eukprot:CDW80868.1 UNKNOWN [Stylonychia lemnae]